MVTGPPNRNKCPILSKYEKKLKNQNIRAIVYVFSIEHMVINNKESGSMKIHLLEEINNLTITK